MARTKKKNGVQSEFKLIAHDFEKLSSQWYNPPENYVFVPKGDVYITRRCRDMTGRAGKALFVVYDKCTSEKLGIHCHSSILEAVQEDTTVTAEYQQRALADKDSKDYAQNQELLLSHFPNIPTDSLTTILGHGFVEGCGRVGGAKTLDEEDRVTIVVKAHIRHTLTNYDFILSRVAVNAPRTSQRVARRMVYGQVQTIADSWRERSNANKSAYSRPAKKSANTKAAATLELNRTRRKARAQEEPKPALSKALPLGKALEDHQLDVESALPISVNQQYQAAIQSDLEKLVINSNYRVADKRILQVLRLFRKCRGDASWLGSMVQAQEKRIRAREEAKVQARRKTRKRKEAANRNTPLSNDEKDLLEMFNRNPDMHLNSGAKAKIKRLLARKINTEANESKDSVPRREYGGTTDGQAKIEENDSTIMMECLRKKGRSSKQPSTMVTSEPGHAKQVAQQKVTGPATQSMGYEIAIIGGRKW